MAEELTGQSDDPAPGKSASDSQQEGQSGQTLWPARRFRATRALRIGNAVVATLTRWGLVPHTYILTTKGRKTGRLHTTPVTLVERDGRRWLVAPYGPVSWVLNARAAGRVSVRRRRISHEYVIREVPSPEAGPVLKQYLAIAGATRPYFVAQPDSPVEDFIAEAYCHPVFQLILGTDPG